MKLVRTGNEPPSLLAYRNAVPHSSWDQMKDDGKQAYEDCRKDKISIQGGLCAFCEIDIRDNQPLKCRVEHFHPKSDRTTTHNWALDWLNMLGVCNGGDNPHLAQDGFHLPPTSANLSCDAHKNRMIQQGFLPVNCEGWILDPREALAFPCLFRLDKATGALHPNSVLCAALEPWPGNKHDSLEKLVGDTIKILNLNCDRLTTIRRKIINKIEHKKKEQRQAGFGPEDGLRNIAQHYFRTVWPGFFTTIRLCLGQAAETYLHGVVFEG